MSKASGTRETIEDYIRRWSDEDMVNYSKDEDFLMQLEDDDLRAMVMDLAERMDGYINALIANEGYEDEPPFHNEDDAEA